ncbi:hypothetical protein MUK70_30715 [Dyadobacter chenwenxiniae]|uniref:DUF4142 domain-containing protein n=1 Tax=Dyadobacter chenwenxiniae TaxID=2906456 RepID=A0A9X1PLR0_9BACT|nr:hypothetical protein [Dyadobacter chenwenxiniae]MCF0063697.1 hypothetical protein [Dyadobacter chenwenxiniae]UON83373.1 hypothetical protein MUK70_30715 [Dyadobacter chenwenxiniae]
MKILLIVLICLTSLTAFRFLQTDKQAFYKALSSGEEAAIDQKLADLAKEKQSSRINAYTGALTMKKAGFVKGVKGKVKIFKKGAHLLEEEITNNPANTEYRFLRLTVQEHAPGILKYNKQLDEDKQAVISGYNKLDSDMKAIVSNYAKNSKVLRAADLK